ncbi:Bromodomain-containing protein [Chytridium lagenaria]|nr:Bromodomain-containing protein [Chytridium lagenaria]
MDVERVGELRQVLRQQEDRFLGIVREIKEIREGKWDERLRGDEVSLNIDSPITPIDTDDVSEPEVNKNEEDLVEDEVIVEDALEGDAEEEEVEEDSVKYENKVGEEVAEEVVEEDAAEEDVEVDVKRDDAADEISQDMDVDVPKSTGGKDDGVDNDDLSGGETSDGGANPKEAKRKLSRTQDKKRGFKRTCNLLWGKLTDHKYGNVFLRALRDDKGAKYQDLIKKPTNLTTIKNKVRDEEITTFNQLHRDILLMFANVIMFNDEDSDTYQMAQSMRVYAEEELQAIQSAQQLGLSHSL